MMLYRSFTIRCMEGGTPNIPAGFRQIALFDISGAAFLPLIYWLVLAALLHIILRRTVFGKYVTAVGSNEKVSRIAGLNVKRIICLTYMLAGIMTAIAAVIQVSSTGALNYANAGAVMPRTPLPRVSWAVRGWEAAAAILPGLF